MSLNSFSTNTKFYDDKNFPYGFQRSGYFTITESDCLIKCGHKMNQLAEKTVAAQSKEEKHFLKVLEGKEEPENEAERAYIKYRKILAEKEAFVRSVTKVDDDGDSSDDDSDNDFIDDDDDD